MELDPINLFAQEQTYAPGQYVEELKAELENIEVRKAYLEGEIKRCEQTGYLPTDVA